MKPLLEKLLKVDLSKAGDKDRKVLKEFAKSRGGSAFDSAHKIPKAIWFYDLISNELEYSETASGHRDRSAFSPAPFSGQGEWVRGRVFEKSGKYYMLIYMDSSVKRSLLARSIGDLYRQVQDGFELGTIVDIVDQDNRSLTESRKRHSKK